MALKGTSIGNTMTRQKLSGTGAVENASSCQKTVMIYKCLLAAIQNPDKGGNLASTLLMEQKITQKRSYSC
jgi:hypothetical protein